MAIKQLGVAASGATDVVDLGDVKTAIPWTAEIHSRESTARATGTMDAPLGVTVPYALSLTTIYCRFSTGDGSGSTTIQFYRNGSTTGMPTLTISSGSTAGTWSGTPVALSQYDVLSVGITTLGGTPGNGLSTLFVGTKT